MHIRDFLMPGIYTGIAAACIGITVPMFSGCSDSRSDKPVVSLEAEVEQKLVAPTHVEPTNVNSILDVPGLRAREVRMTFPDVTERLREIYKDKLKDEFFGYVTMIDGSPVKNYDALFFKSLDSLRGEGSGFSFSHDENEYPDDIGNLFFVDKDSRRIFSINPEDKEFIQSHKPSSHVLYIFDFEDICFDTPHKRVSFQISGESKYTTKENPRCLVLADIENNRKLIFDKGVNCHFLKENGLIVLTSNTGDVLYNLKDNKVVLYHPNEKFLCFTPGMKRLVLYKKGENRAFHLYNLEDKTELEFWKGKEFDGEDFHPGYPPHHISNNGRFFAIESRGSYLKRIQEPRSGESWTGGLAAVMTDNLVEVYDFRKQASVQLDITDKVPRAVPILDVDNEGNLFTGIGLLRFNGQGYNFEPDKEEIERQRYR